MCLEQQSAILCATCSREALTYGVGDYLNIAIFSIHSPDYGSTVLVSIFISKTILVSEHHLSAINTFVLVCVVRVIEFSASIVHVHCKWYVPRTCTCTHIHTYDSSTTV